VRVRFPIAMIVRLALRMVVPVVVVDVAVRVPVLDAVRMGVNVRMRVALVVGFGLVGHDAKFGPKMGKAR
jgi:hypothetical protein